MSRRLSPSRDRTLRIELLRARAAMERQSLTHGVRHLGRSLTPRGLMQSFMPGGGRAGPSDFLMRAFSLTRRYPMLLSLGSALLGASFKRRELLAKLALGGLVAWKLACDKRQRP